MPSESISIDEPRSSNSTRQYFRVSLRGADGQPLANEGLTLTLQGDGSLASGFDAKEAARESDASGIVPVTWFRRGIFSRDAKAVLTITSRRNDASIRLEQVDNEEMAAAAGPWISWAPRRLKFK